MLNLLLWLVVGSFVGWLAGLSMPHREGMPSTILVAMIGALIGGFLFNYNTANLLNLLNPFNLTALLASLIGAVILVVTAKLVWPVGVRGR